MNLRALYTVFSTSSREIEALAQEQGLDPVISMGVVKLLLANDGNLASLSPRQKQHFELTVKPLMDAACADNRPI